MVECLGILVFPCLSRPNGKFKIPSSTALITNPRANPLLIQINMLKLQYQLPAANQASRPVSKPLCSFPLPRTPFAPLPLLALSAQEDKTPRNPKTAPRCELSQCNLLPQNKRLLGVFLFPLSFFPPFYPSWCPRNCFNPRRCRGRRRYGRD